MKTPRPIWTVCGDNLPGTEDEPRATLLLSGLGRVEVSPRGYATWYPPQHVELGWRATEAKAKRAGVAALRRLLKQALRALEPA
jgi:hypothetical protein